MNNEDGKQIRLPGFEHIEPPKDTTNWETLKEPPKYEDLVTKDDSDQASVQVSDQVSVQPEKQTLLDAPSLAVQQNALPASLKASAEASIDLRGVQRRLAAMLTKEDYVAVIASLKPEVLPELMNSITNGIATADNLMIKTMQEASKNSTTNKLLEYMVQQQQQADRAEQSEQKDKYYDSSIDKIKQAIFHKLDKQRNQTHRTAQDYIDPKDTEVIDADYSMSGETDDTDQSAEN